MNTYQFKTNINCGGCINAVKPQLNNGTIQSWDVNTSIPEKTLTVNTEKLTPEEVQQLVQKAGFKAELLS
jgi:copper chaperone